MRAVALALALCLAAPAFAADFRVRDDGVDDASCGGQGDECASLQQAADNACTDNGTLVGDAVIYETDLYGSDATLNMGSGQDGCDGSAADDFVVRSETGAEILWGGPAVTGWARCDSGSDCDGIIGAGIHDEVWALQVTDDADWDHKRYWLTEADSGSGDGVPTPLFMATTQSITQEVPQITANYTTPDSQGTNTITHSSLSSYTNLHTTDALVYIHCCGNVIIVRDITAHSGTTITYEGSNVTANYFEVRNVPDMIDTPGEFAALEESGGNRWVFVYPRNQSSMTSGIHRATEPLSVQLLQFSTGAAYWTFQDVNWAGWTIGTQGNSGVMKKGLTGNAVAENIILRNVTMRSTREHAARIDPCDNCEVDNLLVEHVMISDEQSIPGAFSFYGTSAAPYTRVSHDGWIHDSTFTRVEGSSIPIFANEGLVIGPNNRFLGPNGQHGQHVAMYRGHRNNLIIDNYFEDSERCYTMQDLYGPIWFIGNVCRIDGAVPQSGFRNWGGTSGTSGGSGMYFDTGTDVASGTDVITLSNQGGGAKEHGLADGFATEYHKDGGTAAVGLTDETAYYINVVSATEVSLHTTYADAIADTNRVNLTASGAEEHRLSSSAGPVTFLWNTTIGDLATQPSPVEQDGGISVVATGLPGGDNATELFCSYSYAVRGCGGCPYGEIDDRACIGDADYNILERGISMNTCADLSTYDVMPTEGWVLDDEPGIAPEDVLTTTDGSGSTREDYIHKVGSIADDGCDIDLSAYLPSDTLFDHAGYDDWSAYKVTPTNIGAFPLTDGPGDAPGMYGGECSGCSF